MLAVQPALGADQAGVVIVIGAAIVAVVRSPRSQHSTAIVAPPTISVLHEFARWLAFENARFNIRCNVLVLGLIDTPMGIAAYQWEAETSRDRLDILREFSQRARGRPRGRPRLA